MVQWSDDEVLVMAKTLAFINDKKLWLLADNNQCCVFLTLGPISVYRFSSSHLDDD
jgi:hypothetical protein